MLEISLYIVFLLLEPDALKYSDKNENCEVDKKFEQLFKGHIKKVVKNQKQRKYNPEDIYDSLFFIETLSNIPSQIYLGDYVGYTKPELMEDKAKWLHWYEENKCTFTMENADSIIRSKGYDIEKFILK